MSHTENASMDSVNPITTLSDETNTTILVETSNTVEQEQEQEPTPNACGVPNGWCKNPCKEGQTICEECTKMMDSYP